jgi:hypothetical protein
VKSLLLHLREEYMEAAGRPVAVSDLVQMSAPGFAALLRNVARLHRVSPPPEAGATAYAGSDSKAAATREGARLAGLSDGIVADVLALDQPSGLPSTDGARLFPEYLAAVEQLARFVDGWRG